MSSIPEAQKVTFCTILKNITKTNIILTFLSLIKIHLEKSQNTFVARLRRNGRAGLKVSHVCGRFRFFFWPSRFASIYQPQSAHRVRSRAQLFALPKKSACSPSGVHDFIKTYSRSAVALLVRNVSHVCGGVARNL